MTEMFYKLYLTNYLNQLESIKKLLNKINKFFLTWLQKDVDKMNTTLIV